jgi:hypothetical protein
MPQFKQDDIVGFLRRQELRAALRSMANARQRALLLEDSAFADAMLEQPPALSGLQPQQIGEAKDEGNQDFLLVEATKKRRLETLFAPQLEEIAELEKTVSEANMIADLARVDLKLHSEMDDRTFADFTKPIEGRQSAPWLRRFTENGIEVIREARSSRPNAPPAWEQPDSKIPPFPQPPAAAIEPAMRQDG